MPYPNSNSFQNALRYEGQDYSFVPRYVRPRDPTSSDIKPKEQQGYYSIGAVWYNKTSGNIFFLQKIVNNIATWLLLTSSSGGPLVQVGVPLGASPIQPDVNGLINFTSSGGSISITGSAGGLGLQNINFDLATPQAQTFVTDVNSPAMPSIGVLNVVGGSTVVNNNNGIRTDGSSGSNVLTIQLTNRISGSVTTANATPTTLVSFAMSSANLGSSLGVCTFDIQIAGYNITDNAGEGYSIFGSVRTDGVSATLIGVPDKIINEEASQATADANLIVSGNNVIIQVTGIAAKTIDWRAVAHYVFVN